MKKSDLYREYARVIDLCEGTNVNPNSCVTVDNTQDKGRGFIQEPSFRLTPERYNFALAIVEGRPVFDGDVLYGDSVSYVVSKDGFAHPQNVSGWSIPDVSVLSWNPPKPKTINITIPVPPVNVNIGVYHWPALIYDNEADAMKAQQAIQEAMK